MKAEYDFSEGQRGKFYHPDARFSFPVYLEAGWSTTFVLMSFLHRRAHGARRDSLVFSACSAVSAVEKRSKLASTRLGETT